jgi:hypothetical protein
MLIFTKLFLTQILPNQTKQPIEICHISMINSKLLTWPPLKLLTPDNGAQCSETQVEAHG